MPLIIKVKRPSVNKFNGKVIRIRIGLTIALRSPSTKASSSAVVKLATVMPGKKCAVINIAIVLRSQLRRSFMS